MKLESIYSLLQIKKLAFLHNFRTRKTELKRKDRPRLTSTVQQDSLEQDRPYICLIRLQTAEKLNGWQKWNLYKSLV